MGSPSCRKDLADFVLERFSEEELPLLDEVLERLTNEITTWLSHVVGDVESKGEQGVNGKQNVYEGKRGRANKRH